MHKIFEAVLNHKKTVLVIFSAAAIICCFLSKTVTVDYEMMDYLPDRSPSTIALDVMSREYSGGIPNARIMVRDVTIPEALEVKKRIQAVKGVTDVTWLDDTASLDVPLESLDDSIAGNYYKDGCALYVAAIAKGEAIKALADIRAIIGEDGAMTGSAVNTAVATESTSEEIGRISLLVASICFVILLLTSTSLVEPVLLMLTIGVAIILNRGTNAFMGEISFISNAAGSVLQLAVSMDYSIFLINRFTELRREGLDVREAMLGAMKKACSPIVSGGLTAITGFATLIMMDFKIGPDMGIVLAKGIALSLVSVLVLLPVLVLYSGKLISKTQYRTLMPDFRRFSSAVSKIKAPAAILLAVLILPCFLAQNSNAFYYGSSMIFDGKTTEVGQERTEIEGIFGKANNLVLMVPRGDLAAEKALSGELHGIPQISDIISYVDTVGAEVPVEYLDRDTLSKLLSDNYSRLVLTVDTDYEGATAFEVVKEIKALAGKYYGDKYYLAGESANTYDLMQVVTADKERVEYSAIIAVFLILLITFRSFSLPLILVTVIEAAVWINLSVPYYMDSRLFYIGYLIISSIQLGSTIDYAILLNDRYLEERRRHTKKEALLKMSQSTALPVLTSAAILTLGGAMIGALSSNGVLKQLGILIARGTVFSTLLVMLVLPALFYFFDAFIQKTTKGAGFVNEKPARADDARMPEIYAEISEERSNF